MTLLIAAGGVVIAIIGVIVLVNGRGRDWLGWVALIGGLAIVALSGILNRV